MSCYPPAVKTSFIAIMLTLEKLRQRFQELGVRRLLMKRLSPNDNSKNQVYLGGDLGVANVIPAEPPKAKITGSHGTPIFNARMTFSWMSDEGRVYGVPNAQLILYPQYPEVRFSGFLRGAQWSPSSVMVSRDEGRILIFGITASTGVIGFAADRDHPVAREFADMTDLEQEGVLLRVPLSRSEGDSRSRLLDQLCHVSRLGWIDPWRLQADGSRRRCEGTNCGGVTLESELGISANGRSEPDFEGWEVKSHTVGSLARPYSGVLTLLTPEPTGGVYVDEGVEAFVRGFGYADQRGRVDRLNVGGIHRVGRVAERTGLTLKLDGYDHGTGKLTNAMGSLLLLDKADHVAASWSFERILAHWTRKHSKAAYVPAECEKEPLTRYRYGERVTLAEGTDYLRLLAGLANGAVYFDPGIKLENASTSPRVKRRNQFRVKFADLGHLYHLTYEIPACEEHDGV